MGSPRERMKKLSHTSMEAIFKSTPLAKNRVAATTAEKLTSARPFIIQARCCSVFSQTFVSSKRTLRRSRSLAMSRARIGQTTGVADWRTTPTLLSASRRGRAPSRIRWNQTR